jgi:hypothetical protein
MASLSVTNYIFKKFGTTSIKGILKDIGNGASIDESLQKNIFISYNDLNSRWITSIVNGK